MIEVSTDKKLLNIEYVHSFLTSSCWAKGIQRNLVEKSIHYSPFFGIYIQQNKIGFTRVITDIFIDENEQKKEYCKQLLQKIFSHKELKGVHLLAGNAQKLCEKFGFSNPDTPFRHMEKFAKPEKSEYYPTE